MSKRWGNVGLLSADLFLEGDIKLKRRIPFKYFHIISCQSRKSPPKHVAMPFADFKRLMEELRESIKNNPSTTQEDEEFLEKWSSQLCGRRVVTNDFSKSEESRIALLNRNPMNFDPARRLYFCSPSETSLNDHGFVAQPQSPLLALPAEIRNQIIIEALETKEQYAAYRNSNCVMSWVKYSGISVIFACKQLYTEGIPIAISNFTVKESDIPPYASQYFFSHFNMSTGRGYVFKIISLIELFLTCSC